MIRSHLAGEGRSILSGEGEEAWGLHPFRYER